MSTSYERLPLPQELTAEQRSAAQRIAAGPRGELNGPFIPLLRSPELMTRLQLVGEYLRYDSRLDDDLFELAILIVARYWNQRVEWGHHQSIAERVGVPSEVIDAVARGRRPEAGRREVILVWDLVDELLHTKQVSEPAYAAALDALGEERVVELVATIGYYATLAMTMNVAGTPPPAGAPRLPDAAT